MRALAILAMSLFAFSGALAASYDSEPQNYVFERFVGEWKLKDDRFQQVWDGETVQTLSIPGHRTKCAPVNTKKSILCEVDAVDFEGHILWAYDANSETVSHLSHFGSARLGDGTGRLTSDGDLHLSIHFSDEPEGTYRAYRYVWVSADEYEMMSIQYDALGNPTGNWYGGSFIRVQD